MVFIITFFVFSSITRTILPPIDAFLISSSIVHKETFRTYPALQMRKNQNNLKETSFFSKKQISTSWLLKKKHFNGGDRFRSKTYHFTNIDTDTISSYEGKELSSALNDLASESSAKIDSNVTWNITSRTSSDPLNSTAQNDNNSLDLSTVCRVVASGDGKLPFYTDLPSLKDTETFELCEKIDAIYHAQSHKDVSTLEYLQQKSYKNTVEKNDGYIYDDDEEQRLVQILQNSLEDAGFELLSRRDLDLCEALNVGYLLRLSIVPDVKKLDPLVGYEFYPKQTDEYQNNEEENNNPLLFDGRVLVFRRGYSSEISRGRLLLPKLDYLQTSLVQNSASSVSDAIFAVERHIKSQSSKSLQYIKTQWRNSLLKVKNSISNENISNLVEKAFGLNKENNYNGIFNADEEKKSKLVKLARYGGSKIRFVGSPDDSDPLTPFLLCEINEENATDTSNTSKDLEQKKGTEIMLSVPALDENVSEENKILYAGLETGKIGCTYDTQCETDSIACKTNPEQLLERVSISDVVDLASADGRRRLISSFVSNSKLMEPTYEEVVVIWRPLPEKEKHGPTVMIPPFIYDIAEIFAIDDRLPPKPHPPKEPQPLPLEIRVFNDVPMANLLGVLPKTRLIFRPADAFLFDAVSVLTLFTVLATQRFDNPKLDIIALISVSLWLLRTVLRYSNKLARYDLLVNKFLTSKLSQKGTGALQYILSEACKQRATRAGLVHNWIAKIRRSLLSNADFQNGANGNSTLSNIQPHLSREQLEIEGIAGINELLRGDHSANIDIGMAIDDLKELNLIESTEDGKHIKIVYERDGAVDKLKNKWMMLFDEEACNKNEDSLNGLKIPLEEELNVENIFKQDTADSIEAPNP